MEWQHGDDFDWFVRARQLGIQIELLPDVLVYRRMHPENRSRRRVSSSRDEYRKLVKGAIDRKRREGTKAVDESRQPDTTSTVAEFDTGPEPVFAAMESAFDAAREGVPRCPIRTTRRRPFATVTTVIFWSGLISQRRPSGAISDCRLRYSPDLSFGRWARRSPTLS